MWQLTGKLRYRIMVTGWIRHRVTLVLQVETMPPAGSDIPKHFRNWRDATVEDITMLRQLIPF